MSSPKPRPSDSDTIRHLGKKYGLLRKVVRVLQGLGRPPKFMVEGVGRRVYRV